ncbi:Pleckstrin y domain-containing family B member 2 [Nymphon striatum]|nr:Pleckstrin y domain-containing family B member 2 [Nymphon striatum]
METSTIRNDKIKAGWILRQTKYFKNWKKYWLVLYFDGYLRYFDNVQNTRAEDALLMPTDCKAVEVGLTVNGVMTPSDKSIHCLLKVVHKDNDSKSWLLCGESPDDTNIVYHWLSSFTWLNILFALQYLLIPAANQNNLFLSSYEFAPACATFLSVYMRAQVAEWAWQIALEQARVMPPTTSPPPPLTPHDEAYLPSPSDFENARPVVIQHSVDEYGRDVTTFIFYGNDTDFMYGTGRCGGLQAGMLMGGTFGGMLWL